MSKGDPPDPDDGLVRLPEPAASGSADIARYAQELEAALRQRTALLHEIDHRVKNNLQLISSLLVLQCRRIENPEARAPLRSMLERVNAVATVHRRLFKSTDPERFDVAEFARDLVTDLSQSLGREGVAVRLDLQAVNAPANHAAALALILNELVVNALKHGFPDGRAGAVTVTVRPHGETLEIEVLDNGVGGLEAQPAFGLTIVKMLSQQVRGQGEVQDAQPGRRVIVRVPVAETE